MAKGTTGRRPIVGWSHEPIAAIAIRIAPLRDTSSIAAEVMRWKKELSAPGLDEATGAAIRQQILVLQGDWVTQAKAEGRREPAGPLDPFRASPAEIENAFLWSAAGGVVPRAEVERDGGRAFLESIRDAVVLRVRGFDALVALHGPDEQRGLYAQELALRGVKVPAGASLEALRALHDESARQETRQRPTIGLDGRVGTAEAIDTYSRQEAIDAMNPGTTLGSMMATYSMLASGALDVERMRALGNAGNAGEGMLGGSGVQLNHVEREPSGR